ncbi:MAG: hypothetical protein ACI9IP_001766 [Arcticibacterium sp.]
MTFKNHLPQQMKNSTKRDFLLNEFPFFLKNLSPNSESQFGLMTPQHMVEHLVWVIKSSAKKYEGERENPPSKRHLGFQKFIQNGAILEHKPSDKTALDLPALRYGSLEGAIALIPEAAQRFYNFWDANPEYIPYGDFIGEMPFEDLELFHYNHVRFHLWQFGLMEVYP